MKCNRINEVELYPPTHNGLVAGSSPAGPTMKSATRQIVFGTTAPETPLVISLTAAIPQQQETYAALSGD
jgi:hypothetical protein